MILDASVEAGLDTHILEEWYCRDENSVPPAYYLKPKAQMLKNYQNSVSPANMIPAWMLLKRAFDCVDRRLLSFKAALHEQNNP